MEGEKNQVEKMFNEETYFESEFFNLQDEVKSLMNWLFFEKELEKNELISKER